MDHPSDKTPHNADLRSPLLAFTRRLFPEDDTMIQRHEVLGDFFQRSANEHHEWLDLWGLPSIPDIVSSPEGWLVYVVDINDNEEIVVEAGTATDRIGLLEKLLQEEHSKFYGANLTDAATMAFQEMELVLIRMNDSNGDLLEDLFDGTVQKWGEWNEEGVFLPEQNEYHALSREDPYDMTELKGYMKEKICFCNQTAYMLILEKLKYSEFPPAKSQSPANEDETTTTNNNDVIS